MILLFRRCVYESFNRLARQKLIHWFRQGLYPFPIRFPVVPASDGAGEVAEVGEKVSEFKKGDKVTTLFNQGHQYGDMTPQAASTGLGGVIDGALRQYGVFNENGLVKSPSNLNALEASSLPCAALTSWNALFGLKPLKPGQTVLVQGTGGVSMFALQVCIDRNPSIRVEPPVNIYIFQFAKAVGARVIATTSSPEKAEKLKKLGADHVINYKTDPNWGETARKLTPNNVGVDHIVEVGGSGTLKQSLKCIKFEGVVSIIGFLGGGNPKEQPVALDALMHICTIRGVYVGSKALMNDMVDAIEANDIHPVLDEKVFSLEQAREAYDYMVSVTPSIVGGSISNTGIDGSKAFRKASYQGRLVNELDMSRGNEQVNEVNRYEYIPIPLICCTVQFYGVCSIYFLPQAETLLTKYGLDGHMTHQEKSL